MANVSYYTINAKRSIKAIQPEEAKKWISYSN